MVLSYAAIMKLAWKEIESFVKAPNPKARAILVYGPDTGLVRERALAMAKTVVADPADPFNVASLTGDILADDPARLADEAMAMSLMGGTRLIRIEDASDKLTPLLKDYLAAPSAENLVILEGGELGPKSSLRALFEKSPAAAALPCYVDDEKSVAMLARQLLGEAGYTIQADAMTWLTMNIAGDRLKIRGEIDKLITYMGRAGNTVRLDDVLASFGEAGAQSTDDLIYAIGSGRAETALFTYHKLLAEGVAVVQIMRFLQGHFRKLHYAKSMMKDGLAADEAMKKLQPPIFFKNEAPFRAQLGKWSEPRLLAILGRLAQIEMQMKQTGAPAETLGAQAILSLAA